MLVLKGVLGTLEVWYSVSLVWGVFGERYKRLVFDSPLKLAIWESPSQENLGLSLWALLTRTWTCGREHVQGYWTSSPTMKVVMVGVLYRTSTNRLQKQGTTPTSSATKSARHSKIWRVKGNYAPLLALFLLPSIPSFSEESLPVNLCGREGFIPWRFLWQRLKDKVCWRWWEWIFALLYICPQAQHSCFGTLHSVA